MPQETNVKKFKKMKSLDAFAEECKNYLLDESNRKAVKYKSEHTVNWDSGAIKVDNKKLLEEINGSANVYAIFTTNKNGKCELKYIGQSKQKYARTRLTNHLIKKHKKTGAKLQFVMDSVLSKKCIKISWVELECESLRHFIEENLILQLKPVWNINGKRKA